MRSQLTIYAIQKSGGEKLNDRSSSLFREYIRKGLKNTMKKTLVKIILFVLNSKWLNQSPCRYDFVGNVDAFSRQDIESCLSQQPDMTLQQYLDLANRFKSCPTSRVGVTAIESDGTYTQNVRF